ncbi:hypothetical protein [Kitasatospora terrestris]|uniref:Uncharacterized protein n=1 Tax=Kitasatospora terrestris TaxID=258051 RepID=A0ABP9DE81_9ACTN
MPRHPLPPQPDRAEEGPVVAEIVAHSVSDVRSRPNVPAAELAVSSGPDGWDAEQ